MQVTIQCKIEDVQAIKVLDKVSVEIGHIRAKLLKRFLQGGKDNDLKKEFIREYGLTARQYNSLSSEVKG